MTPVNNKEWQFIINDEEVYFSSRFRFPLDRVREITLDRKSGSLWIITGTLALVLLLGAWVHFPLPVRIVLALFAGISLFWGIRLNQTHVIGFVILKDPKWNEKIHVNIFQTRSYKNAEKKIEELRRMLAERGKDKVRIVKSI